MASPYDEPCSRCSGGRGHLCPKCCDELQVLREAERKAEQPPARTLDLLKELVDQAKNQQQRMINGVLD